MEMPSAAAQESRERVIPHSNASSRFRQVSQELRRLADVDRLGGTERRPKSAAAPTLLGLRFVGKADGAAGWEAVEKCFDRLAENGRLRRSEFGQCIGMKELEFAGKLFDALARRRSISGDSISKEELYEFWGQICSTSVDGSLRTFFDMMDKDGDGRITEEEVKEIITLSASANKLPRIQEQAKEHAQLIMEELDPKNLGYIEQFSLETLMLEALRQSSSAPVRISRNQSQMLLLDQSRLRPTPEHGPLRRWCRRRAHDFLEFNWRAVWAEMLTPTLRPGALPVETLKVGVYVGDVLSLQFSKPHGFRYRSGQYILINCPAVSRFQWHPFCITSAPHDDYVSVHIRALGDWTRDVKNRFAEVCRPVYECDGGATSNLSLPKVLIDGPYGLTAQDYKQYDVVLLVSLGIGAAAMISIIKDIVHNMNRLYDDGIEPEDANNCTSSSLPSSSCRTQRAYFHWITQEQGSFDWFRSAMDEVVETDMKGVVELHNYCNSLYEDGDARSAIIAVLQLLNYARNGVDIVSGTRVKTHFGKPHWCDVYKRIALNHPDQRVGVFYCGAPVLVKELSELAHDFSRKTTTKFEFHKEKF